MDTANLAMKSSSSSFFSKTPCLFSSPKPISRAPSSVYTLPSTFRPLVKCIQASFLPSPLNPDSKKPSNSAFTCSAVTSFPSQSHPNAHSDAAASSSAKLKLLISEFQSLIEPIDRVKRLLHYASLLPSMDGSVKTTENRVPGCTAQVWLHVSLGEGKMRFLVDSDSEITKGFCACLVWLLDGAAPDEVLALKTEDLNALNAVGLNGKGSASRVNTWHNVLVSMQKRTRAVVAERDGKPRSELFPSLVVTADGIQPKGSYAEAQARFLFPDESRVQELVNALKEKKIGVVAHFYMDPEVQGVLTAAQKFWPHIHISDSLVMADSAVNMAKSGCQFITVLGVDFMSENVRAILDQAGFPEVGVYRMSDEHIGCSLAEAASSPSYMDYLTTASVSSPSLHVVYINTSLETKAYSHELVPTITCTSSNVVQTILQAFAEVPDLKVWYGPDTYMGSNIMELFSQMSVMTDEEISEIHPLHNRMSIKSLLPRLHYFQDGTCIVHHLFGHEVVGKINEMYSDAFLTAHFEVPGEMFSLAMEAKKRGMGVVGSTQNILDFIKQRVQDALNRNIDEHLQFVLGTESGMITSIVSTVRKLLGSANPSSGGAKVSVEIVFPVSSESVTRTSTSSSLDQTFGEMRDSLKVNVIPGVASGEGCSLHGGCASCPYMKASHLPASAKHKQAVKGGIFSLIQMNSLSSLLRVCHSLPHNKAELSAYEAGRFSLLTPKGKQIADIGCEPILHMRHFQATKRLPEQLINQILQPCDNGQSSSYN